MSQDQESEALSEANDLINYWFDRLNPPLANTSQESKDWFERAKAWKTKFIKKTESLALEGSWRDRSRFL